MFGSLFKKLKNVPQKGTLKDPVCGMQATDGVTFSYKGHLYAFCSDHCRQEFQKNPERYVKE